MIEITDLTKYFSPALSFHNIFREKTFFTVIDELNLNIKKGEVFGLIGPNGAGKTTLIKILAGLISPDKGNALINNYDPSKNQIDVKRSIGLILAGERSFYWRLTGQQNLVFYGTFYGLDKKSLVPRINELSDLLHLSYLNKRAGEYSTGMQQRLKFARALLHNPPVLLMDEPTRSLDYYSAEELRSFIRKELVKKQGKTVLMVTHNLKEAEDICDRIGVIKEGKLVTIGKPDEIRKSLCYKL
ncbi:MAG: ABC transporter ATP-binding protein [Planctomycetes bacterium]|nr:ABC transporter ATP-binding protein [Planctomycetota bacterium]